jgi:hypothetical protein
MHSSEGGEDGSPSRPLSSTTTGLLLARNERQVGILLQTKETPLDAGLHVEFQDGVIATLLCGTI